MVRKALTSGKRTLNPGRAGVFLPGFNVPPPRLEDMPRDEARVGMRTIAWWRGPPARWGRSPSLVRRHLHSTRGLFDIVMESIAEV